MTEQEMKFVENQFKKIGIGEAFTSELAEKMKRGEKLIEHHHTKIYSLLRKVFEGCLVYDGAILRTTNSISTISQL